MLFKLSKIYLVSIWKKKISNRKNTKLFFEMIFIIEIEKLRFLHASPMDSHNMFVYLCIVCTHRFSFPQLYDEPVHTRWQITTWMLLLPICFACVCVCLPSALFPFPSLFFSIWFGFTHLRIFLLPSPLRLSSDVSLGNKLLHPNTSEKSSRTIRAYTYYANMVHLNIYLIRTVDATRIWLIWDRNLSHNFKLRMVECNNSSNNNGNLRMFAPSRSPSLLSFIRLIKSRA